MAYKLINFENLIDIILNTDKDKVEIMVLLPEFKILVIIDNIIYEVNYDDFEKFILNLTLLLNEVDTKFVYYN